MDVFEVSSPNQFSNRSDEHTGATLRYFALLFIWRLHDPICRYNMYLGTMVYGTVPYLILKGLSGKSNENLAKF